jgi:hypothetical protein
MNVDHFLASVASWAETQPELGGIVLVGSYARGAASATSDIDLVLLAEEPEAYLRDRTWLNSFGEPVRVGLEDWGKVTSVRVFYADGREVEFGLAGIDWGGDPSDEGTTRVIRAGARVLYDRGLHLASRFEDVARQRGGDVRAS